MTFAEFKGIVMIPRWRSKQVRNNIRLLIFKYDLTLVEFKKQGYIFTVEFLFRVYGTSENIDEFILHLEAIIGRKLTSL